MFFFLFFCSFGLLILFIIVFFFFLLYKRNTTNNRTTTTNHPFNFFLPLAFFFPFVFFVVIFLFIHFYLDSLSIDIWVCLLVYMCVFVCATLLPLCCARGYLQSCLLDYFNNHMHYERKQIKAHNLCLWQDQSVFSITSHMYFLCLLYCSLSLSLSLSLSHTRSLGLFSFFLMFIVLFVYFWIACVHRCILGLSFCRF